MRRCRFLKKFKSDKDPKFVERLPELAPGSLGTCAIVGNADNLLRNKWGPEIDMHDFVVRFNTKMKVGSRTRPSFRFSSPLLMSLVGGIVTSRANCPDLSLLAPPGIREAHRDQD